MTELNQSGRKPFGVRVMVKMKKIEKKTPGGLVKFSTDKEWEKAQLGVVVGQIVAKGQNAWYDITDPPQIGEYVIVKRYAGVHIEGVDGEAYRQCLDIDIHTITQNGDDVETIG